MKRLLCLILTAATLICLLPGCAERVKEPVTFYYLRENPSRGLGPEIAGEIREGSGHRDNLRYLLAFYLMGPADKELTSPLPRGTTLYQLEQTEDAVTIGISDTSEALSDSGFSLACACLSMTCMELLPVKEITVVSGSRNTTIRRDSLILKDTIQPQEDKS